MTAARNSSSIGSISGEWNAWLTRSRLVLRSNRSAIARDLGLVTGDDDRSPRPLTAASETPVGESGRTSASVAATHHHATRGEGLHELGLVAGPSCAGVFEGQHAGDVRGGDLTDRVARPTIVRPYAVALHEPVQRHLEREQRGAEPTRSGSTHPDPRPTSPPATPGPTRPAPRRTPRRTPGTARTAHFRGLFTVDLAADEILVAVQFAPVKAAAYAKLYQRASHFAIVGVAAALEMNKGVITSARIGVTGASSHATRLTDVEAALAGQSASARTIATAVRTAGATLEDLNSTSTPARSIAAR